jgi:tetratricopeptide (TPR) repeat protein
VQEDLCRAVVRIGLLAHKLLLAGHFAQALEGAEEAIAEARSGVRLATDEQVWLPYASTTWIAIIRAHALMLLGRVDEARGYFRPFAAGNNVGETSWQHMILKDFIQMRGEGLAHPLMGEVETQLAAAGWVRDMADDVPDIDQGPSYDSAFKLGDELASQNKIDQAAALYRRILSVRRAQLATDGGNKVAQAKQNLAAHRLGRLASPLLLAGKFAAALDCVDEALGYDPNSTWLNINRAHVLMFLDRANEARAIYLSYRDKRLSRLRFGREAIKEDFAKLRKALRPHNLMSEIERQFAHAI